MAALPPKPNAQVIRDILQVSPEALTRWWGRGRRGYKRGRDNRSLDEVEVEVNPAAWETVFRDFEGGAVDLNSETPALRDMHRQKMRDLRDFLRVSQAPLEMPTIGATSGIPYTTGGRHRMKMAELLDVKSITALTDKASLRDLERLDVLSTPRPFKDRDIMDWTPVETYLDNERDATVVWPDVEEELGYDPYLRSSQGLPLDPGDLRKIDAIDLLADVRRHTGRARHESQDMVDRTGLAVAKMPGTSKIGGGYMLTEGGAGDDPRSAYLNLMGVLPKGGGTQLWKRIFDDYPEYDFTLTPLDADAKHFWSGQGFKDLEGEGTGGMMYKKRSMPNLRSAAPLLLPLFGDE